jgi:LysM repeat protein
MTAGRSDRRPVRLRRRGRHTSPSQVEKVAQQAGKAAPAVAIAGALVAVPQASHALADSAKPVTVTTQSHATAAASTDAATSARQATAATLASFATRTVTITTAKPARHATVAKNSYYQVRSGDSLAKIADQYYQDAGDWQYLYHENDATLSDPNLIYPGQRLFIPATVPANYTLPDYVPRHAKPVQPVTQTASSTPANTSYTASSEDTQGSRDTQGGQGNGGSSTSIGGAADGGTVIVQSAREGMYSCSGLEQIWEQAGGSSSVALMAAEIAMAESGGNPDAISPTDDYGLWQINASNGSLATLNPLQNARSAIDLSQDGTNWGPWTTYTSGAYAGKC